MKKKGGRHQHDESPPPPAQARSGPSARVAIAISCASLFLSLIQAIAGWIGHNASVQAKDRARQLQAFVLGRRATVYESAALYYDAMLAHVGVPDSTKTKRRLQQEVNAKLTGNDMVNAASLLGLNLSPKEDLWMLESRISGQLRDLYSPRVNAAYRLGRLLGGYDERAYIVVDRTVRGITFLTSEELSGEKEHQGWTAAVDSLWTALGMGGSLRWGDAGSVWSWCADGREALERSGNSLSALGDQRAPQSSRVLGRDSWEFAYLVTWERDVWEPRSIPVLWVSVFGRSTASGFEGLVGRLGPGWRPNLGS